MHLARFALFSAFVTTVAACNERKALYDPREPARGPGSLVGNGSPITSGVFPGGTDTAPTPRDVSPPLGPEPPDCDEACEAYCADRRFANPVNRGVCPSLWGVGLATRPIVPSEACRRLYADTLGRFPDADEISSHCTNRSWGEVVHDLLSSDEFVTSQRRRWADRLLYNNEALSIARIYDMDLLVAKTYRGLVPYDQFAALAATHPVLTRRYATAEDRAEAAFRTLLGRPPFERERADLARLYVLWDQGYYEHPSFGRSPDAFIQFRCLTDDGERDSETVGACTSILWGYNELVMVPDARVDDDGRLWAGLLGPDEWDALSLPGKILAREPAFWERAVDDVLQQYLGYNLSTLVPRVREELVDFFLAHSADIRAVHFAVLTSIPYLQSAAVATPDPVTESFRYTSGPLKQAEAETWIDTIEGVSGKDIGSCDFRLPDPWRLLREGTIGAYALVADSDWTLSADETDIEDRYLELARSLGGCPENLGGGRFKTVSILTTATQEGFVTSLCNPSLVAADDDRSASAAPIQTLLPTALEARRELTIAVGRDILAHQVGKFFGREPTLDEYAAAEAATSECAPKPCTAEAFARPLCFALLSGAEMLFY